ncbi:MAG: cupin domain-containing protein [Paracoccaceae bacterium]
MKINADFTQRVVVHAAETDWIPSPMPGVDRKMLDRIGAEVARATSIVRYAPGSAFSAHTHDGGEEFLVLDGTFVDEHGAFPAGTYVRNPPTTSHTPSAPDGATILVKLHQFDTEDRFQTYIDTTGEEQVALYSDAREEVRIETWAAGQTVDLDATKGMEVFVISGSAEEGGDTLSEWDWLRLPVGGSSLAKAGPEGARVWIKSGHLEHVAFDQDR